MPDDTPPFDAVTEIGTIGELADAAEGQIHIWRDTRHHVWAEGAHQALSALIRAAGRAQSALKREERQAR